MPEGDTILRTARNLSLALVGRTVTAAAARDFELGSRVGKTIERVAAHGKNLYIHFDDAQVLHSHMRMTGSWHLYALGEPWRKSPHSARAVLTVPGRVAVCFAAPVVALIPSREAQRARRSLGPDLLAPDFELDTALDRLRALADTPLGEALVDQRAVSGIGNIYKSETLFVCRCNPYLPVRALDDASLRAVLTTARELMMANLGTSARVTTPAGVPSPVWVYRRAAEPCLKCGELVAMRRQGEAARSTYHCGACQSVRVERA